MVGDINHVPGILNFASAEGRWWFDWGGGGSFRLGENVRLCNENSSWGICDNYDSAVDEIGEFHSAATLCLWGSNIFFIELGPEMAVATRVPRTKKTQFSFGTFLRSGQMCLEYEGLGALAYQASSQTLRYCCETS